MFCLKKGWQQSKFLESGIFRNKSKTSITHNRKSFTPKAIENPCSSSVYADHFPPLSRVKKDSPKIARKDTHFKRMAPQTKTKVAKETSMCTLSLGLSTFIDVKVQNHSTTALIDSGASVSVCSIAFANFVLSAKGKKVDLKTANNESLPIVKRGFLLLNIAGRELKTYVYVTKSLSSPLILGDSFLKTHQAIIDYKSNCIQLTHQGTTFSAPFVHKLENSLSSLEYPLSLQVVTKNTTCLAPLSVTDVNIHCEFPAFQTNFFFEPNFKWLESKNLYINRCCLTQLSLPVKNLSHQEIILYPDTPIGTICFKKNLEYFQRTNNFEKKAFLNLIRKVDADLLPCNNINDASTKHSKSQNRKNTASPAFPHSKSITGTVPASTGSAPPCQSTNSIKMAGLRSKIITVNTCRNICASRFVDTPTCINRVLPAQELQINSVMGNYFTLQFQNAENENETHKNVITNITSNTNSSNSIPENLLPVDKSGTQIFINRSIPPLVFNQVKEIIQNNIEVFASSQIEIHKARLMPAEINLTDNIPVHSPPFHMSPMEDEQLHEFIGQLKQAGIVRDSTSPYASPAFLVTKPGVPKKSTNLSLSDKRFVVDYRRLNAKVIPDRYPLPRIESLITELRQFKYFSKFDFLSGFFQQELSEKSRKCSAFTTSRGLFEFNRQPMGIKNGSSSFSRALNKVFADLLYHGVIIFIDDLIVYSKDYETHVKLLNIVFERLKKHFLRLKTSKSQVCCESIDILGYLISHKCIAPSTKNLIPILNAQPPKSLKELRSFLGSCSFYRKFIHNFAKICSPLYDLLKISSDKQFTLTPAAKSAFKTLISLFTQKPVLQNFNEDHETVVIVDTSKLATGSILAQRNSETKKLHPIGYFSKKLQSQPSWGSTELELQGLALAVPHFRDYLYGRKFTVFSDHNSLEYFTTFKEKSSRLNKLVSKLVDYDFDVIYKKASSPAIKAVDHLSRFPVTAIIATLDKNMPISNNDLALISTNFNSEQLKDPQIEIIRKAIISPKTISDRNVLRRSRRFSLRNDLIYLNLWCKNQESYALYVPKSLINSVLHHIHDDLVAGSAHFSFKKCYDRLKRHFYWPTMRQDLATHISRCHSCNLNKPAKVKYGLLQPIPPPLTGKPFSHIICDFLGPLPSSYGHKYILIAICTLTKYAITKATHNADANTVAKFLISDVISQKGFFSKFSTDRGSHFDNELITELSHQLKFQKQHSTAYRPQSQGLVERLNQTIVTILKHYISESNKNWSTILPFVTFAYNSNAQASTGYSPFYLVHGYEPDTSLTASLEPPNPPVDLLESIEQLLKIRHEMPEIIKKAQDKYKRHYDKSHIPLNLTPGSQVYVTLSRPSSKLSPLYQGPYMVVKKVSDLNYEVAIPMRGKLSNEILHVSRLKPVPPKAQYVTSVLPCHNISRQRKYSI